jgi:hypothetical protein
MLMNDLPLPIARGLLGAEEVCAQDSAGCYGAIVRLVDSLTYYLGAVVVGQYSQGLYTGQIEPDATLNRSLRSLRRVLPGQWLGWAARGLEAAPNGPVEGLAGWYSGRQGGDIARSYEELRRAMVEQLGYTGEYSAREEVSPRILLEMIDHYRIRRSKVAAGDLPPDFEAQVGRILMGGLHTLVDSAGWMREYQLYAPQQRQLLMGPKPTVPMPPIPAPADTEATLLLYPLGEAPDYTKRPNLQAERLPLFPLDPLLVYLRCEQCGEYRVAALSEVAGGVPKYVGLDPECGHEMGLVVGNG